MKRKMILKIGVDISMTVLLMLLMTYSLIGEAAHEWIGVAMFVLFVVHHILNGNWSRNVLKGRYTALRVVQTLLVVAVLLCMAGSMVSGVVLSNHVFDFLAIYGEKSWARTLHMICAYWGFIVMSLHLGFHWSIMVKMAGKLFAKKSAVRTWIVRILAAGIAGYGVFAFGKRSIAEYMFLRIPFVFFDYEEPLIFFMLDYLAIMGLFVFIGHYLAETLKGFKKKSL